MATTRSPFTPTPAFVLRASAGLDQKAAAALVGVSTAQFKRYETGRDTLPEDGAARLAAAAPAGSPGLSRFRFIDLFAGIGGMRRAFDAAGGECRLTAEWDKFALETYLANHGAGHQVVGDITKVAASDVPDHDVLVAGFPCQPFSISGVSKKNSLGRAHGFADATQGTLFFDVARIIEAKRPRMFLLENVKNLAHHDKGRTFKVIMDTLTTELGYNVSYRILDSRPWVPQKRRRIFIVGVDSNVPFDFDTVRIPDSLPTMASVLHGAGETDFDPAYTDNGVPLPDYTLTDGLWGYLQRYAEKHAKAGNGFGYGIVGPDDVARTLSARYGKDGSEILVWQDGGANPRSLTPRECARLMGFDTAGHRMKIPVSDTQAYRQFGNSVVVPCVSAIAGAMAEWLEINTLPELMDAA